MNNIRSRIKTVVLYLAIFVQVGVETVGAVGVVVAERRRARVLAAELHVEHEQPALVGRLRGARDHHGQ